MRVERGPRIQWVIGAAVSLGMASCAKFPLVGPLFSKSSERGAQAERVEAPAPPQSVLEVQDIHYDGWTLSARVLISPESGPLRLNRQLIPTVHVQLWGVSDCKSGAVASLNADLLVPRPRPEDLLVVEPGYWYGRTVSFKPFDEHFTGIGPECVEAYLRLFSFDGQPVTRQRIRAVRPAAQDADGGMPPDGGVLEEPRPAGSTPHGPQEVHGAGAGWE